MLKRFVFLIALVIALSSCTKSKKDEAKQEPKSTSTTLTKNLQTKEPKEVQGKAKLNNNPKTEFIFAEIPQTNTSASAENKKKPLVADITFIPPPTKPKDESSESSVDEEELITAAKLAKEVDKANKEAAKAEAKLSEATEQASNDQGIFQELGNLNTSEQSDSQRKSTGQSDRIFGARATSVQIRKPKIESSATFSFDGTNDTVNSLTRVSGQARGYSMLYLMHPRARQTVEAQIEILLKAEIENVFLAVLTDGTFRKDFSYLSSVIRRLNVDGRNVHLLLYLTNGPTMRNYDRTPISTSFNRIEPKEFRNLIKFNPATREAFRNLVKEVRPIFELNSSLNVRNVNYAAVMLEDNLDNRSYQAMRDIAEEVLGNLVQFVRNPCPKCYPGNEDDSFGDIKELHETPDLAKLEQGDGYTLDGASYKFAGEKQAGVSIEQTKNLITTALEKNLNYFGLWRIARQGLQHGQNIHPDDRTYEVPTEEQAEIEIELLRTGLE
ncbi:MAG: hypothetical protein H6619_04415 [Deltaproteobacteria bacterium]|nr:hypothetical protein [Deltaproteobacteria bacterium]